MGYSIVQFPTIISLMLYRLGGDPLRSLIVILFILSVSHNAEADLGECAWGTPCTSAIEGGTLPTLELSLLGYFDVYLQWGPLTSAQVASNVLCDPAGANTCPDGWAQQLKSGMIIAYQSDATGDLILPPVTDATDGENFCYLTTDPLRGFIKPDPTNFIRLNDVALKECAPGNVDAGEACTDSATCNGGTGEGTGDCIGSTIQTIDAAPADTQICLYHPRALFWADYLGDHLSWELKP